VEVVDQTDYDVDDMGEYLRITLEPLAVLDVSEVVQCVINESFGEFAVSGVPAVESVDSVREGSLVTRFPHREVLGTADFAQPPVTVNRVSEEVDAVTRLVFVSNLAF
jgi:hypothetical protein